MTTSSARESMAYAQLSIVYDDRVLRPRPWTVMQSEWAAELSDQVGDGPILELCTGAGHIGLLAAALSGRRLVAVDVDEHACELVRLNAESAGLSDRVEVRLGGLEGAVGAGERFPLVIADPPWVVSGDVGAYPEDPRLAIDGGPDGLDVARRCLAVVEDRLEHGGRVLLQLGTDDQVDRVTRAPWREVERRSGERGVVVCLALAHA